MEFYKLKYFYNAQVLKGAIDFKSEPWPKVSEAAKDCVRRLLDVDVTRRATAEQILKVCFICTKRLCDNCYVMCACVCLKGAEAAAGYGRNQAGHR